MTKPLFTHHVGLAGVVQSVELIDEVTGEVEMRLGPYKNLIVDAGLDGIAGCSTGLQEMLAYCGVGTDSTAPAVGQTGLVTALGSRVAKSSGPTWAWDGGDQCVTATVVYEFAAGVCTGSLTEFGIFKSAGGAPMWMRQLFVDDLGAPVTINKTASKVLRITYVLKVFLPTTWDTKVVSVDVRGTPTNVTITYGFYDIDSNEGQNTSKSFGGLPAGYATGYPDNTAPANPLATAPVSQANSVSLNSATIAWSAYTNGNFYRDCTFTYPYNLGNITGGVFGAIKQNAGQALNGNWVMMFNPKLDKRYNLDDLVIVVRYSWARV